jgi:hypothetical protein
MSLQHKQRLATVAQNLLCKRTCKICHYGGAQHGNKWWCDLRLTNKQPDDTCPSYCHPNEMSRCEMYHR